MKKRKRFISGTGNVLYHRLNRDKYKDSICGRILAGRAADRIAECNYNGSIYRNSVV